jgi:hypothetical protein
MTATTAAERAKLSDLLEQFRKTVEQGRATLDISSVCAWRCATPTERAALLNCAQLPADLAGLTWRDLTPAQREAIAAGALDAPVRDVIAAGLA